MRASVFIGAAALLSVVAAVPYGVINKRFMSIVTVEEIETIEITTTIYYTAGVASTTPHTSTTKTSSTATPFLNAVSPAAAVAKEAAKEQPKPTAAPPAVAIKAPIPVVNVPVAIPSPSPSPSPVAQPKPQPQPQAQPQAQPQPQPQAQNLAVKPASNSMSSSGGCTSGSPCTGDLTTYEVGLGSCGFTNSGTEAVVAISHLLMGSQSNGNPMCGKKISITYNGRTETATVVDKCGGCAYGSVDLSDSLYQKFNFDGRAHGATWSFL